MEAADLQAVISILDSPRIKVQGRLLRVGGLLDELRAAVTAVQGGVTALGWSGVELVVRIISMHCPRRRSRSGSGLAGGKRRSGTARGTCCYSVQKHHSLPAPPFHHPRAPALLTSGKSVDVRPNKGKRIIIEER